MGAGSGLRPSPVHGLNPWPSQVPVFEAVLRQYISGCLGLGEAVMRGIALGLGLPEGHFGGCIAGAPTVPAADCACFVRCSLRSLRHACCRRRPCTALRCAMPAAGGKARTTSLGLSHGNLATQGWEASRAMLWAAVPC